jgi:hypothetical protein
LILKLQIMELVDRQAADVPSGMTGVRAESRPGPIQKTGEGPLSSHL